MLYLIGGAVFAGKTSLTRRLFREKQTSYFCADYFVRALERGAPELEITAETSYKDRARKLWPRIAPMLMNIVEEEPNYTVEGSALLPGGAISLMEKYDQSIRACFIGYAFISPEQKVEEIRRYGDWGKYKSETGLLDLCKEMIDFSQFIREGCGYYHIPYFDISDHFTETLARAYQALTEDVPG